MSYTTYNEDWTKPLRTVSDLPEAQQDDFYRGSNLVAEDFEEIENNDIEEAFL